MRTTSLVAGLLVVAASASPTLVCADCDRYDFDRRALTSWRPLPLGVGLFFGSKSSAECEAYLKGVKDALHAKRERLFAELRALRDKASKIDSQKQKLEYTFSQSNIAQAEQNYNEADQDWLKWVVLECHCVSESKAATRKEPVPSAHPVQPSPVVEPKAESKSPKVANERKPPQHPQASTPTNKGKASSNTNAPSVAGDHAAPAPSAPEPRETKSALADTSPNSIAAKEARAELAKINPFGETIRTEGGGAPELVNPFGPDSPSASDLASILNVAKNGISASESLLARNVRLASKSLPPKSFAEYRRSSEAMGTILTGFKEITHVAEYGVPLALIATSKGGEEPRQATADLARNLVKELGTKSIATTVTRIFGKEAAATLVAGPVGIAAAVVWDVFTPEREGRSWNEVIRDNSGTESLADKQKALAGMWLSYGKHGGTWQLPLLNDLLENTKMVQAEAGLPKRKQ
jgi:hypothetical protein